MKRMHIVPQPKHEKIIMSKFESLINAFERVMAPVTVVEPVNREKGFWIIQPERFGTVSRDTEKARRQLAVEPESRF